VHWGFVGYAMSVPVFLFYIYFCLKYFENRKGIYILILSLFLVLIFLMHFQTAIFGILVILVMAGFNKRKNIFFLLSVILIVLPVLIIMIYAYKLDANYENNGLFPYLFSYYLKEFIFSIPLRLKNLFLMDNFYFFEQPLGSIFAYIFSFIILLPVVIKFGEFKNIISVLLNKETDKEKQTNIISWETKYYLLLLIISLMCYFFLPDNIPGQNIIYERFSVFILIFTIIISGVIYKDAIPGFYKKTAIIIICGIYFTIISFYFIQFDNEANCFTKDIFPEVNSGKVLAGIIIDNDFKGRPVFTHFPMYYTVWKNGITTGLVDYRFGVIKRKADKEKLPVYKEWLDKDFVYNNEYNNVDYIIVKDKEETKISYYRIIKKCGEWRLFSVK
jgi:hypothetical protein